LNGIPAFRFPESAARALAVMTKFHDWLQRPLTVVRQYRVNKAKAERVISSSLNSQRASLLEHEAYEALEAYGFPVIKFFLATTEQQAMDAAEKIGYPVVCKIVSPDILHKFDFKGVRLNLKSKNEVKDAYNDIIKTILAKKPGAEITGILIEEMAASGKEIILGMNRDPQFGPLLMFGLGGTYVEVLEDVTFRLAPIREITAKKMIEKTKANKILQGFRGEPPYDTKAISECIKRLSQLVTDFDVIKELDINPLIVYKKGSGCAIVDARIILENNQI